MFLLVVTNGCAVEVDPAAIKDDQGANVAVESAALSTTTAVLPVADTKLSSLLPFWNFGSSTKLAVNGVLWPDATRTLVRFDTAQVRAAIGGSPFVSAKLVLTITGAPAAVWELPAPGGTPQITTHRMLETWSEMVATWYSVLGFHAPFAVSPTCTIPIQAGQTGQVECDVTSDIVAFLGSSAPNYGWMLKDEQLLSGVSVAFGSRESATPPKLVITFADSEEAPAGIPAVDHSVPGELTVDGSDGANVLDVAPTGMTFASNAQVNAWAIANLNAIAVVDATGATVGVQGTLVQKGQLYYADATTQTIQTVDDYIAAMLGGRTGIVTVAGVAYCLREDGCLGGGMTLKAAPPASSRKCNAANDFCIDGSSWVHNYKIYNSIGSEVVQQKGGYKETTRWCWKAWFIPWRCTKKSGHNDLFVTNDYRWAIKANLVSGFFEDRRNAHNAEDLTVKQWSLFVGLKVNADGLRPTMPIDTAEADISGVCGKEVSISDAKSTNAATSKGNVTGVCDGPIGPQ